MNSEKKYITRNQILLKALNNELKSLNDWRSLLFEYKIAIKDINYFKDKYNQYTSEVVFSQKLSKRNIEYIINNGTLLNVTFLCYSNNYISNEYIKVLLKKHINTEIITQLMKKTILSEDIIINYIIHFMKASKYFVNFQRISKNIIDNLSKKELNLLITDSRFFKRQRIDEEILKKISDIFYDPLIIKRLLLYQNLSSDFLVKNKKMINRYFNDKFIRKLLRHNKYMNKKQIDIFK